MSGLVKVEIKNHDGGTTTTESPYTRAGVEVAIEFLQAKLLDEFGANGTCGASERKRYTAQEMREMADCISNIKQSEMSSWKEGEIITGGDLCRSAEMLRQAADTEEENVQLKARLEAVEKECERRMKEYDCGACTFVDEPPWTFEQCEIKGCQTRLLAMEFFRFSALLAAREVRND